MNFEANLARDCQSRDNVEACRALLKASSWLVQSGIQEQYGVNSGGFYSWFSTMENSYPFLSTIATGYAMTTLIFLDRILMGSFRDVLAEMAASWLIDKAWIASEGGFMTRFFPNSDVNIKRIYTLDVGAVLNGFVNLFRETGNNYYLAVASKAVDFIMGRMKGQGVLPFPALDVESGEFIDERSHWGTSTQPYLSKVAIGLLGFADVTQSDRINNHAQQLLEWVADVAESSPHGAVTGDDKAIHLHPTAYAIEALIVGAVAFEMPRMLEMAYKTWRFIAELQLPNGGFPSIVGDGDNFERTDVCAQFIRAGLLLEKLGMLPEAYNVAIEKAVDRLVSQSSASSDPRSFGGILHSTPERPDRSDPSTIGTMFSIQAFALASDFPDVESLLLSDLLFV